MLMLIVESCPALPACLIGPRQGFILLKGGFSFPLLLRVRLWAFVKLLKTIKTEVLVELNPNKR